MQKTKIKNIIYGMLVMFIAILFFLALMEAAARITEFIRPGSVLKTTPRIYTLSNSNRLGIEVIPNLEYNFEGYLIKTNNDGLRDKEYPLKKPENTFRIVELGGSFTFGMGSPVERIYPTLLENKLNNGLSQNYDVINLGLFGINTIEEIEMLKLKGLKYSPDLVILDYSLDDTQSDTINAEKGIRFFLRRINNFFLRKSISYSYFRSVVTKLKATSKNDRFIANLNDVNLSKKKYLNYLDTIYSDDYKGFRQVQDSLKELYDLSVKHNFKVLIVFTPELRPFTMTEETLVYFEKIENQSKQLGFETLSLFPALSQYDTDSIAVSQTDRHPNKIGHELIASAIYEKLINSTLLTKPKNNIINTNNKLEIVEVVLQNEQE
ncbi:SGNH/GDSL hydrolase family protein [Candidatus Woesearchaeota archaeon]|nr:SGNH/GDSL hydrolase family protein [Candidatus Woesearchaeota archaeon]